MTAPFLPASLVPRSAGRLGGIALALLLIALPCSPHLSAQSDGTTSVLRQRMMVFGANGLVGAGVDTITLPQGIPSGQHFVGNRSLDARGGRYAQVYHSNPTGVHAVYFRWSTNGLDWSAPVQVSDPRFAVDCYYASVKYVGRGSVSQRLVATYLSHTPGTGQDTLWGTTSSDGGATWASSTVVGAHPDAVSIIPTLHSAGDTVLSVWTRMTSGNRWDETFVNRSRDGGRTWDTMLVAVNGSQFSFYSHAVVGANGRAWIATSDDQFQKMNSQLSRSSNAGSQWSEITNINTESGLGQPLNMIFYPALERGSGNTIYSVWSDNREGASNIYFARSDNSGANWTPHVRISGDATLSPAANDGGQAGARRASITLSGMGRLYALWADDREGPSTTEAERNRDVYITQSTDEGESWSAPIRVNTAPQVRGQESPALAIHSTGTVDSVLIVWSDTRVSSTAVPEDPMIAMTGSGDALRIGAVNDGRAIIEIAPSLLGENLIVTLVDAQGAEVATLHEGRAGSVSLGIPLPSETLPPGVYFLHARCGTTSATMQVVAGE